MGFIVAPSLERQLSGQIIAHPVRSSRRRRRSVLSCSHSRQGTGGKEGGRQDRRRSLLAIVFVCWALVFGGLRRSPWGVRLVSASPAPVSTVTSRIPNKRKGKSIKRILAHGDPNTQADNGLPGAVKEPKSCESVSQNVPSLGKEKFWQSANDILEIISESFVDHKKLASPGWEAVRKKVSRMEFETKEQYHMAMSWAVSQLGDPFSRYLRPEELTNMKGDLDGCLIGIGIVFSKDLKSGYLFVDGVLESSPAHRGGIRSGNGIVEINGTSVKPLDVDQARELMLGRVGQSVEVRVTTSFSTDTSKDSRLIKLVRREIQIPSVSGLNMTMTDADETRKRVVYLRVREFRTGTSKEVARTLRTLEQRAKRMLAASVNGGPGHAHKLEPPHAYVVDVRGNVGGVLDEAIALSRMFLPYPRRRIVSFESREFEKLPTETTNWFSAFRSQRSIQPSVPMFILVDSFSASASEIFAAALVENCRAVLIGTRTFGKGSVQAIMELEDSSGLSLTIANYITPAGNRILPRRGLKPHIAWRFPECDHAIDVGVLADDNGEHGQLDVQRRLKSDEALRHLNDTVLKAISGVSRRRACLLVAQCDVSKATLQEYMSEIDADERLRMLSIPHM
ncbi:Carboxyl-terminal-processing peptidase 3, chloroplastic [Porphyridium purpureum]|uniref:Carboxyl-terminal-processing peptidase 3, chloroplastic n=1 Tax=Porphyridium purpureum TaxID=35688 RepID=A0A5J4YVW3_PORPP|nr:Carboxyl-terminal-processing peptidase 3, chloroplastic [Porphyridium purpureum]|eukprot:POR6801..scf209_3